MIGRTALILVAGLTLGRSSAEAQTPSLPIPVRVETLASAKVGEPREFWVSLPDRYPGPTEKYPVLYMMDGDMNFNSGVIGGVRQAAWLGEIPEFIIVGMKNTNRSKDIFPEEVTYPDGSKDGGRANQYLDFIRDELMPRVEKTYRASSYRVLYGTSNTGFTAVYGLFRTPDLASAYIAASATLSVPSFRSARDRLIADFKGGTRQLVLVMGEHDLPTVVSQNGALKEAIGMTAPAGLTCRLRVIENGEHVPPDALVEGLRALFQGWKITSPLTESSFAEIRAQVDGRLEKFGVPGKIDEEALKGLGDSLLGEKKFVRALEVLEYRAASYPQSADAQVGLGDGYRQSGNLDKARECYKRALVIAPGHAAATTKLKEVGIGAPAQEKFAGYLDQAPPEQAPRVFRLQTHEGYFASDRIAISADGKELYYTEVTSTWSDYNIRYYKYADQKWHGPFDLFRGFLGPALSVDGKTMLFENYNDSRTCWHSKRTDTGWSTPTLCTEVPDPKDKHYLQDTASGRIYASSRGALNGIGQMDISTLVNTDATGGWRSLGRPLNSPGNEGDFYVARDETFIVFGSPHRGGAGGGDLFVSFRESDGSWSDPKNLGATINTPGYESGPYVTDDTRYLFFSRSSDFTRVDVCWVRFDSLLETLRTGTTPSDLPAHTYVIEGRPSDVVQNHAAVLALARQLETNLKADIETFGIHDKATLTRMYSSLMATALVTGDRAAARRYLELVRELQDNPAVKLLTGVVTIPYMQAMDTPGTDFRATYRTLLSSRLASLPFEDVQAILGAMKSSQQSASRAQVIGSIAAGVDPAVKDGQLSQQTAEALVGAAMNLEVILPLKEDVVACIANVFDAHKAPQTAATAGRTMQPAAGTFKTRVRGIYFGQALPGDTPVPFAPEILTSISAWVAGTAFSPDGTQMFVAVGAPDYSRARLYYSTRVNGEWTPVVAAPFASDFIYSNEPVFSADGKTLTFTGRKATGPQDLWTVRYADQTWGAPVALPSPISSDAVEYRGSYMSDGTLYFTSTRSGMYQVYKAYRDASRKLVAELVGPPVSTNSYEGDPCIAPDGRFLVFNSARDGKSADLFVSFPAAGGGWGTPINLGPAFNSSDDEYGAHLSSDGEYLFFTRHGSLGNQIYWVAVSAIEKLRPS